MTGGAGNKAGEKDRVPQSDLQRLGPLERSTTPDDIAHYGLRRNNDQPEVTPEPCQGETSKKWRIAGVPLQRSACERLLLNREA